MTKLRKLVLCWAAMAALNAPLHAGGTTLTTERIATGLSRPVYVTSPSNDTDRLFIVEQGLSGTGRIKILDLNTGVVLATPFLTISGMSAGIEQGLLGLAFHPDYDSNGFFYVNFTSSGSNQTRIRRYTVSMNPNVADPASATSVLSFFQPFTNNNGGWIGFGPDDGFLYVATGDGGSANDPQGTAQDITNQSLGKILRIDVDADDFPADPTRNYAIPPDNPFVGTPGDDEIWHFGLRNPWRCSFDRTTGALYIGDVGQEAREEVSYQPAGVGGLNFGWRCMEGGLCTGMTGCVCGSPSLEPPIHEYTHTIDFGFSIIGGYVYRGCAMPSMRGTYFFADYVTDRIWSFRYDGTSVTAFTDRTLELGPDAGSINNISSFGEDAAGEIYICDLGGELYRIVPELTVAGPGAPFCFGVGCPCGNDDHCGNAGCINSTGFGAVLTGSGSTSVTNDDLVLTTMGCPPNNTGLYFMGGVTFAPVFVGDGLGCTGGIFRYFPSVVDGAGTFVQATPVASAPPGAINPGDTRHFQSWTRDVLCGPPPAPCPSPCGNNRNLSSGYSVVFTP